MNGLGQDLRIALRVFWKNPAFAAIVVLTLALGSGANTAIFTLLDQVMLRALPVDRPERLVVISAPGPFSGWSSNQSDTAIPVSQPMLDGLRDKVGEFRGVLGRYSIGIHLSFGGQTESVNGDIVTGSFFEVLGLQPAHGRLFTSADDVTPSGHPVVVLGHDFFMRRFGGDPSVVGRTVNVNNHSMTVIGVAPRGFNGVEVGSAIDVYVPVAMQQEVAPTWGKRIHDWRSRWLVAIARLENGVTREQALASANVVYAQLVQEDLAHIQAPSESFKQRYIKKSLVLLPGGRGISGLRDQSGTPLVVLMGMVGLVLLIACANVASLLLTRASSRQKEIAVRLALGASRSRLIRLQLVESVALSIAGGLVGLQLAYWVGEALILALPFQDATRTLSAAPDWRIGLFTLAVSVLTGVGFGLVPALRASQTALAPALKSEATSVVGGAGHFMLRKGLVVAQVALSLLLLVGAGLFTRSLMNLRALDPGFKAERLFAFTVDPSLSGQDFPQRVSTHQRIETELSGEPGVTSVGAAEVALLTNSNSSSTVRVDGYESKEGENMNPNFNYVSPGFFTTLGMPILAGRDLAESDVENAPRVAVVNEVFVRYFYKDQNPIGRRFGLGRRKDSGFDVEIVGVVRDGKAATMREEQVRFVYVPFMQEPSVGGLTFYVRSTVEPDSFASQIKGAVGRVDATLPVTNLKTMQAQIGESLFVERMVALLSAAFGALATILAAIGLYGVMSYAVTMRTREIGLRVALGADQRSVLMLVLREVAILAGIGIGIGLPLGLGLGKVIESQLFGMTWRDPLAFGIATLSLVTTAFVAGLIPALRAARVDPMTALRYE